MTEPDRRVVHVSSAHPHTDNRIHARECRSLVDAGYEVALVAVQSEVESEPSPVRVIQLPRRPRIRRALFSAPDAIRRALRTRARTVHLHDPELIPFIPLLRLAGRRVVYDAHEDLPMQVLSKPYTSAWNRPLLAAVARILVRLAASANLVVAATEQIATRFPASRTVVVRNFPPLRPAEERPAARRDVAVYVGALGRSRGLLEMLAATRHPEFPVGWQLHLAGRAAPDGVRAIEAAVGEGRVVYHGQLAPAAARDLLLTAKLGIVTLHPTRAHLDSLPTKMFEYFAARLPVVASDFPLWRRLVGDGAGLFVDPSSAAELARAVARYAADPQLHARHAEQARHRAVSRYNWESEAAALVDAYEGLTR